MQKQEKASMTLSLHQEIEREAQEIEKEMAQHPELDKIQVTEEMDRALRERIRVFEKEMEEERRAAKKAAEGLRELRGEAAEDAGEDGSGGSGMEAMPERTEGPGRHGKPDDHVEFSAELVPDLSGIVANGCGKERKYAAEERNNEKVVYRKKERKYWFVSLAAVLVIVLGVGANSVGSKSYLKTLWDKILGTEPVKVINVEDMEIQETEDGDEIVAYKEIEDKFHIKPIRLLYKPDDMELENYVVDEKMLTAQLFYRYQDEVIRYILYINKADSSWGEKEEDVRIDNYSVFVNEIEIKVEEFNKPNQTKNRQVAQFKYHGVEYQLIGVMEKEELKKILENLYFF